MTTNTTHTISNIDELAAALKASGLDEDTAAHVYVAVYGQIRQHTNITESLNYVLEATIRDANRAISDIKRGQSISPYGVLTSTNDVSRLCAERLAAADALNSTRYLIKTMTNGAVELNVAALLA